MTVTVKHSFLYNEPITKASVKKLSNCYVVTLNNPNLPKDAEAQLEKAISNVEKYTGLKFVNEHYEALPYIIIGPFGLFHPQASVGFTCIDDWSFENEKIEYSSIDTTIHELLHTLRMQNNLYGGTPYEEGLAMYNTWSIKNKYYGYNEKEVLSYNGFDLDYMEKDKITPKVLDKYLFEQSPDDHVTSTYFVEFLVEKYGMKTIDKIIKEAHKHVDNHCWSEAINKPLRDATIKYTSKSVVTDYYNWLVKKNYLPKK